MKLGRLAFFSFVFIASIFYLSEVVKAQEFSSTNFSVSNPVIAPGGYSTSTNFSLIGVVSQIANGTSTGATRNLFGGFLYYPFVTTPALSATAGNTQVVLTWTAASAGVGWNVGGYSVGQSTTSGGPYTYTSVGNVLTTTVTGLTNSATYYFIVRALDGLNNVIATSTQVSSMPVAGAGGGGSGGGGGGGGGGGSRGNYATGVIFSGRAYPLSKVTILKDGQIALTTIAGPDSNFKATLTGLSGGDYNFSVYGTDKNNIRSSPFTFPIYITPGVTTEIGGIFIAPTIAVDKSEVRKGDTIAIFGQTAQDADVAINVNSSNEYFVKSHSDKNGIYLLNFDSSLLELGKHSTRSKALLAQEISSFSYEIPFIVGTKNVEFTQGKCPVKGDLNNDCRVNLVDFSIAAFWYKKPLSDSFRAVEKDKLNSDGKIDLVDFSIMAYYWTG